MLTIMTTEQAATSARRGRAGRVVPAPGANGQHGAAQPAQRCI